MTEYGAKKPWSYLSKTERLLPREDNRPETVGQAERRRVQQRLLRVPRRDRPSGGLEVLEKADMAQERSRVLTAERKHRAAELSRSHHEGFRKKREDYADVFSERQQKLEDSITEKARRSLKFQEAKEWAERERSKDIGLHLDDKMRHRQRLEKEQARKPAAVLQDLEKRFARAEENRKRQKAEAELQRQRRSDHR